MQASNLSGQYACVGGVVRCTCTYTLVSTINVWAYMCTYTLERFYKALHKSRIKKVKELNEDIIYYLKNENHKLVLYLMVQKDEHNIKISSHFKNFFLPLTIF